MSIDRLIHSSSPRLPRLPRLLNSSILAFATALICGAMWLFGWLPALDRVTGDFLLRSAGNRTGDDQPIAVIVIDDRAIELFGPLPWPRSRLAEIVEQSFAAGALGVAIDLILAEPGDPTEDLALARALSRGSTVLATAFDSTGEWLLPLEPFGGAGVAAHAYGEVGPDGVVRSYSATKQSRGLSLPALPLAAARMLRPDVPITPGATLRPDFNPAPQNLPRLSAASFLNASFQAQDISDRIVFIGISATGASDQFVVPTGPRHTPVAGVLAHASAASSILGGRLLRLAPALWSLLLAFSLAGAVQLLRDRCGSFDLVLFFVLLVGVAGISGAALRWGRIVLPVATLIIAMLISALLREAVESGLASRETGRLLKSLSNHLGSPDDLGNPRSARARLEALQHVQSRILEEDSTRQALLAGMGEGVILWDDQGKVMAANPAVEKLWGHIPSLEEIEKSGDQAAASRHRRELSLNTTELASGHLAIIRDITAERLLERRRGEMQRLVSHELKTPLASISGLGETLERYQLSGEELARVASLIRGEADRLHHMVTVFLDLERLGAGHWEGETGVVDLGALVHGRLEILQAAAAAREIHIDPSIDDRCPTTGVPALLERVIDNLVGNAVKYTHPGDHIEVEVRGEGGLSTLTVRDHGPGIPEQSRDHLFERFYRVPGSQGAGAGLGLSLVKEVVSWHGGCISYEGEPGAGSTFKVCLPGVEED